MRTVSLEDGKYEFDVSDNGLLVAARRHGEPWPAGLEGNQYSKSFMAAMQRILDLESNAQRRERLR